MGKGRGRGEKKIGAREKRQGCQQHAREDTHAAAFEKITRADKRGKTLQAPPSAVKYLSRAGEGERKNNY